MKNYGNWLPLDVTSNDVVNYPAYTSSTNDELKNHIKNFAAEINSTTYPPEYTFPEKNDPIDPSSIAVEEPDIFPGGISIKASSTIMDNIVYYGYVIASALIVVTRIDLSTGESSIVENQHCLDKNNSIENCKALLLSTIAKANRYKTEDLQQISSASIKYILDKDPLNSVVKISDNSWL